MPTWLFNQEQSWIDAEGQKHELDDLSLAQLLAALTRCEASAEQAWRQLTLAETQMALLERKAGRPASMAPARRLRRLGPNGWLQRTKLYQRLTVMADTQAGF
jgi:hypothetical protein